MADRFSQQCLRVVIAQLCQSVGWHAIQTSSSDVLVELLEHYLLNLGRKTAVYSNHANRTQPSLVDVFHAFEEVGVSLRELLEYFNEMEVEAQFDPAVPSFPVHKPQSHVYSGLGTRKLRKPAGGAGIRLLPGGKMEVGSSGEGEDVDDDDDDEEEEMWEEIPGYLPPLPKTKEEIGGDNGDDAESGIHISEGEATPVALKSPLGQSGLPALFRQRSQSISEEEAGSRGSSVSAENLPLPLSRATGGSVLNLKNEDMSEKPVLALSPQTGSQLYPSVSSSTLMLIADPLATQESHPVTDSGMPPAHTPLPRHIPKTKPNLRINTGMGVATSSVTTPIKEEPGISRQGSPCDQPRLPTLHRISPMGGKGSFYSPHTPTLSPLLGTPPTSPQVSVATRPVLHPLIGSPVGFAGKYPSRAILASLPAGSGPSGSSPVEKDVLESSVKSSSSADISPHFGNETGEPLTSPGPESVSGEISVPTKNVEQQPESLLSEPALLSSPHSSVHLSPTLSSPSAHGRPLSPPPEPTSVQSPSLSPSLHSPSPSQRSPSLQLSPSPLPSSQSTPSPSQISHSRPSGEQSSSPEAYPPQNPPLLGAPESSNSSPSSQGLSSPSPSPSPITLQPPNMVSPSPTVVTHGKITAYSPPRVASSQRVLSPSTSSSSSSSSSSSVVSSSPPASDAEHEPPANKQESFLPSPSNTLLAPMPQRQSLATPPPPSQLPCPPTGSLVPPHLPSRQQTPSSAACHQPEEYLSSPSSELSGSDSSTLASRVGPALDKRESHSPSAPNTVPRLKSQVPRLPPSHVPHLQPSQVPPLPSSQVPRLSPSQVPHLPSSRVPHLPSSQVPRPPLPVQTKKKRRRSIAKKVRVSQKKKERPLVVGEKKVLPHLIVRIKKKLLKKDESGRQNQASFESQLLSKRALTVPNENLPSENLKVAPVRTKRVSSILPSTASRDQTRAAASTVEKPHNCSLVVSIQNSLLPRRTGVGMSKGHGKGGVKMSFSKMVLEKKRTSSAGGGGVPRGRSYKRELELSELGLTTSEPQSKKIRLVPTQPPALLQQMQPSVLHRQPTSSSSSSSDSSNESSSDSEESVPSPTPPPAPSSQVTLPFPVKRPHSPASSSDNESVESKGRLKVTLTIPKQVPEYQVTKAEPAKSRRTSSRTQTRHASATPTVRGGKSSAHSRRLKSEQHSVPSQQNLRSLHKQQVSKRPGRPPSGARVKAPPPPTIVTVSSTFTTAPPVSEGPEICICPTCRGPDNGTPMICCDSCDIWLHLACVGLVAPPPEDQHWYCSNCQNSKKKRRRKH